MIVTLWDGPWPNWRVWADDDTGEWMVVDHHDGKRLKQPLLYVRSEHDPKVYRCSGEVRRLTTRGRKGKVVT